MGRLSLHGNAMMIRSCAFILWSVCFSIGSLDAAVPKVLVSIAPIHSLVTAVMQGIGTPELLLKAEQSPHHFFLSPSQTKKIAQADLIFWVGDALESFLVKPIQAFQKRNFA